MDSDRPVASPETIMATCPRPVRRPVMLQGWHDLTSIHWPFAPEVVQRLLPPELTVDVCEGKAWVGVIPFDMQRVRVPRLPAFGPLSTFPETNVRTYVVAPDGRRAVWFCSLDITRLIPALVARVTYGLPYCWAQMSIDHRPDGIIEYSSRRRWPGRGPHTRFEVEVGEAIAAADVTELEHFLTARWALASTFLGQNLWAAVDHGVWPLHRAQLRSGAESLVAAAGLPDPVGEPVVLWSPGVEVRIGRPARLR